ncbi:MAG: hypothetical protein WDM92_01205 [Caulobacteraceae bacterium]
MITDADYYFEGLQRNDGHGYYPFTATCNRLENGVATTNNTEVQKGQAFQPFSFSCKEQFSTGYYGVVHRDRQAAVRGRRSGARRGRGLRHLQARRHGAQGAPDQRHRLRHELLQPAVLDPDRRGLPHHPGGQDRPRGGGGRLGALWHEHRLAWRPERPVGAPVGRAGPQRARPAGGLVPETATLVGAAHPRMSGF